MKLLVIVEHTPVGLLLSWELLRFQGFRGDSVEKNQPANAGDMGLIRGLGSFPWRRAWRPSPISCLEDPHGQRRLAGCSPCGHKELSMHARNPGFQCCPAFVCVCVHHCCPCAAKTSVTSETQLVTMSRKVLH